VTGCVGKCRNQNRQSSRNGDSQCGTTVEVCWPFAVSGYHAARSTCGDRRSIGTGVTLELLSLLMSRIRWLLASLMRA
jgi:hypothetical protein